MNNLELLVDIIKSLFILAFPLALIPFTNMLVQKTSAMTLGQRKVFNTKNLVKKELAIFIKLISRVRIEGSEQKSILVSVVSLTLILSSFAAISIYEPMYINFKKYFWEIIDSKAAIPYMVITVIIANLLMVSNDGADTEDKSQYFIVSKTSRLLISGLSLILALLSMFFYCGSVDTHIVIQSQTDSFAYIFPKWGILIQPISAAIFVFSLISIRASGKTNLVLSNNIMVTEKRNYAVDAINRIVLSLSEISLLCLFVMIYLGGYNSIINSKYISELLPYSIYVFQALSFFVKFIITYLIYNWILKVIPQFKYYRLIIDTWKRLLPLSLVNLILTVLYFYLAGL